MSAFGNRAKFCEKTRDLAADFAKSRCTAHAELGWRAPRALHNMHGVAKVLGKVSAAFGGEIARCRRLEIAQNFARKGGNVLQISLNFGAPRMQNSAGVRRVRCTTRTTSAEFSVKLMLRLAARLRDVGVWKSHKNLRENARPCCKFC